MTKGIKYTREGLTRAREGGLFATVMKLKNEGVRNIMSRIELERSDLHDFIKIMTASDEENYINSVQEKWLQLLACSIIEAMCKPILPHNKTQREYLPNASKNRFYRTFIDITRKGYGEIEKIMRRLNSENHFAYKLIEDYASKVSEREGDYAKVFLGSMYKALKKQARLDKRR